MCVCLCILYVCLFVCIAADWVDATDPNVKAETELLKAAASIEAAARKLAELKPREKAVSYGACLVCIN